MDVPGSTLGEMTTLREEDRLQRSERGIPSDSTHDGRPSYSSSKEVTGEHLEQRPSHTDTKSTSHDHNPEAKAAPAIKLEGERALAAPEWIRNLTVEERQDIEAKLKRKLDTRLMPMIVLMYIMNYLDRVSVEPHLTFQTGLIVAEQHCCSKASRNCGRLESERC